MIPAFCVMSGAVLLVFGPMLLAWGTGARLRSGGPCALIVALPLGLIVTLASTALVSHGLSTLITQREPKGVALGDRLVRSLDIAHFHGMGSGASEGLKLIGRQRVGNREGSAAIDRQDLYTPVGDNATLSLGALNSSASSTPLPEIQIVAVTVKPRQAFSDRERAGLVIRLPVTGDSTLAPEMRDAVLLILRADREVAGQFDAGVDLFTLDSEGILAQGPSLTLLSLKRVVQAPTWFSHAGVAWGIPLACRQPASEIDAARLARSTLDSLVRSDGGGKSAGSGSDVTAAPSRSTPLALRFARPNKVALDSFEHVIALCMSEFYTASGKVPEIQGNDHKAVATVFGRAPSSLDKSSAAYFARVWGGSDAWGMIQWTTVLTYSVGVIFLWGRVLRPNRDLERASSIEEVSAEQSIATAWVRYAIWAIPSLGFLGTVAGIGQSLVASGDVLTDDVVAQRQAVRAISASLGTAFDTTFVALALSLVIMVVLHVSERQDDRVIALVAKKSSKS